MRLLICTSILDGVRALWRSLNNICLNLIVGDVFSEQSGKNQGNVWEQQLNVLIYQAGIYINIYIYNNCIHLQFCKNNFDIKYHKFSYAIGWHIKLDLNASITAVQRSVDIYTLLSKTPPKWLPETQGREG